MHRYIILLLVTGNGWAQTGFDILISKDGTKYLGEYSKVEDKIVYFKPKDALEFQAVPLELIETLRLKDGVVLIQSGRINGRNLAFEKSTKEYEKLTIEEKAVYDAKRDTEKWLAVGMILVITAILGIVILGSGSIGGGGDFGPGLI